MVALLDEAELRRRLVDEGPYAKLDVVTVTGSTNTDLSAAAAAGAPDRTLLFAEEQQAGRGRMRRTWISPRGYGLHVSAVLRPASVPQDALGWLPLLAGIALAEVVRDACGVPAALKWPNDLLLGGGDAWRKGAGILAEAVSTADGMAIVVGIGVNVHHGPGELPTGAGGLPATSLAEQGADVDRQEFAVRLLTALAAIDDLWREHAGDVLASGLLDRYQRLCGTLGRQVRVELGGNDLLGTATGVDADGRLLVRGADGAGTPVSAGDVVHLRPR